MFGRRRSVFVVVSSLFSALLSSLVELKPLEPCSRWPPVCSQHCSPIGGNSFRCSCVAGYQLAADAVNCRAPRHAAGERLSTSGAGVDEPYLLFGQSTAVMKLPLCHLVSRDGTCSNGTPPELIELRHTKGAVIALAFDVAGDVLYWFDALENKIVQASLSNAKRTPEVFIEHGLGLVVSMAFDSITGYLYIGDFGERRIVACSTRFVRQCTVVRDNVAIRAIAVDPITESLFWSECQSTSGAIKKSNLDGSDIDLLVNTGILCANRLSIDFPVGRLYWADPYESVIASVRFDGSGRQNVTSSKIVGPREVAVFEENVYWIHNDLHTDASFLSVTSKYARENNPIVDLVKSSEHELVDVQVVHRVLQTNPSGRVKNHCANSTCSDMCLPNGHHGYTCMCPPHKTLDQHGTCRVSWRTQSILVASGKQLLQVFPQTIGHRTYEPVISFDESNVTALAFDWSSRLVFVATSRSASTDGSAAIWKYSLNTFNMPNLTLLIDSNLRHISSMSVDWLSKHLYWVDSEKSTVEMSTFDGRTRLTLFDHTHTRGPQAVAVDPIRSNLYLSECERDRVGQITLCDLDGAECRVANLGTTAVGCATSLVVDVLEERIYWSDRKGGLISSANLLYKDGGPMRHSPEPTSLTVSYNTVYWSDGHSTDLRYHGTDEAGSTHHDERIFVGHRQLGPILAVAEHVQPEGRNGCSEKNGGCSHVCISISSMQSYCVCPSPLVLSSDRLTCGFHRGDATPSPTRDAIARPKKRTTSHGLTISLAPPVTFGCFKDFCSPLGDCIMDSHRGPICRCKSMAYGDRCEKRYTGNSVGQEGSRTPEEDGSNGEDRDEVEPDDDGAVKTVPRIGDSDDYSIRHNRSTLDPTDESDSSNETETTSPARSRWSATLTAVLVTLIASLTIVALLVVGCLMKTPRNVGTTRLQHLKWMIRNRQSRGRHESFHSKPLVNNEFLAASKQFNSHNQSEATYCNCQNEDFLKPDDLTM